MLIDEFGKRHKAGVLKEKVINTVGSGDSMVAGFVAGYEKTKSYPYALKLGIVDSQIKKTRKFDKGNSPMTKEIKENNYKDHS